MNRYLLLALLLLVPLAVIAAVAISKYGMEGPADNDARADAMFRLVGTGYGTYVVVAFLVWRRGR